MSGMTPGKMEQIDAAIRAGTSTNTDWGGGISGFFLNDYRNHKLRGIESWITFSYVIRKTITTTNATTLKLKFIQIPGTIITYNSIGVPSWAKFTQPKVHLFNADPGTPNVWSNIDLDQWMVKAPTQRWQKGKKAHELIQEYWGAVGYSSVLYEHGNYTPGF